MSKDFTQAIGNNLLVVDAINLAFRWKHSGTTEFHEQYLDTINSLKQSYKAKYVIIVNDWSGSSFRKGIYPEYKGNRAKLRDEQTQEEKDTFFKFLEDFKASLEHIRDKTDYLILQYKGVEADDLAAFICSLTLPVDHIWLISTDKDWDLLLSDEVSRFSYVTRKESEALTWKSKNGFELYEYIDIKCLTGDTGDNIPGVTGVGPKRALELVQKYGTIYDIISNMPIQSNLKYIQELNKSEDLLLLNQTLMDLEMNCEIALGEDNCSSVEKLVLEYMGVA